MSLINELKRRNVFRVVTAYIVISWLVLQVADVILNNIGAPDWVFRALLLLLGIGLLFAIFFSWVFEMTPEGLKRESEVDRTQSISTETGKKLNRLIIGVMALALLYFAYDKFFSGRPVPPFAEQLSNQPAVDQVDIGRKDIDSDLSIAVLPFVNLSSDPEQEYFSDGISEELLNVLAKIPDLHVTSRSSAFAFKGKEINIPEVARTLGVAHILEGSVRKSGKKVRITAQLIEAESDRHLWSETYDRSLDDIFAVQDEISASIVTALVNKLGLDSDNQVGVGLSQRSNIDAYTTYLLAQHQYNRRTAQGFIKARELFEKAIEFDPGFAPAYAELAIVWLLEGWGYGEASVTAEEARDLAEPLIQKALELDPAESNAYAAKGLSLSRAGRNEEAVDVLKRALEINPSNSNARNWLSMSYRYLRRSREELETLRQGHRLDPLKEAIATNLVKSLTRFGLYAEAREVLKKLESLSRPDYGFSMSEFLTLQGRYADAIEAALRSHDPKSLSFLAPFMAAYLLAAMGEETEPLRLDPWDGQYTEFLTIMYAENRDSGTALALLTEIAADMDPENRRALMWAQLRNHNFDNAAELAVALLDALGSGDRLIDMTNLALAIIAWHHGNPEEARRVMNPLMEVTRSNLEDGDKIAVNYLILAIGEFIRGNSTGAIDHLRNGFRDNAPMSFEGLNVYAVYAALGWYEMADFNKLLQDWERHNQSELGRIFDVACNVQTFKTWTPLPESCARYAPTLN